MYTTNASKSSLHGLFPGYDYVTSYIFIELVGTSTESWEKAAAAASVAAIPVRRKRKGRDSQSHGPCVFMVAGVGFEPTTFGL